FFRAGISCIKRVYKQLTEKSKKERPQAAEYILRDKDFEVEEMLLFMTERVGNNYKIELRSNKIREKA
ncbi:MAG: hypothetical protein ACRCZQ_11155, partial [Bacteroidales bacterium]